MIILRAQNGLKNNLTNMKALILRALKSPVLFEELETPKAAEGESVVEVKAAALNHRDVWITKGLYPGITFPAIMGSDGAGTVDGREVIINPSLNWGENPRVQGKDYQILGLPSAGTFATHVVVPTSHLYDKPAHLTFEQAAALPLAGLTAYRALFTKCQLKAGENVLISGVGGGVALFACQFAIAAGANVYVSSSSEEKIAKAVEMGAKGGANYKSENFVKELKSASGGFDVVIDSAAGDGFGGLVKMCRPGARVAFYGATRGAINGLDPRTVFWKQISIFGSTMGTTKEFEAMVDFVAQHKIVPVVDSVYELRDGNAALKRMDEGLQFGKIVLKV